MKAYKDNPEKLSHSSSAFFDAFGVHHHPCGASAHAVRWAEAVALGGRGRAAAAVTLIGRLLVDPATPPDIASLASSTRASLIRQAGGHARALPDDGWAFRLAGRGGRWAATADADALVGLAADRLGIGDRSGADRLLGRAHTVLDGLTGEGAEESDWVLVGRPRLRWEWVNAEAGLYGGDPERAVRHIRRAAASAADCPSPRHRLKTELIAAATLAAQGRLDEAAAEAEWIRRTCAEAGLLPLAWAAASLSIGVLPGDGSRRAADYERDARQTLRRWGMGFSVDAGDT